MFLRSRPRERSGEKSALQGFPRLPVSRLVGLHGQEGVSELVLSQWVKCPDKTEIAVIFKGVRGAPKLVCVLNG